MKRSPRRLLLAFCLCVISAMSHQTYLRNAIAQEAAGVPPQRRVVGVPPAALLTDRGRELAESLKSLRRTRANLGPKHPTLPVIEQAIAETEQQLRAWLPNEPADENPFKDRDSPPRKSSQPEPTESKQSGMNDTDLRQLVLRLHARIETLEKRVRTLERAQK